MGRRQNNGIVRRPVEYLLAVAAVLLLAVLVWVSFALRDNFNRDTGRSIVPVAASEPKGYFSEIQQSLEKETPVINSTYGSIYSLDEYNLFMAAADDVDAVYDESLIVPSDNFCASLSSFEGTVKQNFADKRQALETAAGNIAAAWTARTATAESRIADIRNRAAAYRQKSYQLLIGRGENQDLYETFWNELPRIVDGRNTAVDYMWTDYGQQLQQVVNEQTDTSTDRFRDFESQTLMVISRTRRDCSRQGDRATALMMLGELRIHRLAYADARRSAYESSELRLKELSTERNARGVAIRQAFEQELQGIRPNFPDIIME